MLTSALRNNLLPNMSAWEIYKFSAQKDSYRATGPKLPLGTNFEHYHYLSFSIFFPFFSDLRFGFFFFFWTYILNKSSFLKGTPQVELVVKNLPASAADIRDMGSITGLGSSPGEGNGNPLQYSCFENSMCRGA